MGIAHPKKGKRLFFAKKKQKTFGVLSRAAWICGWQ
jgi:hypothetical protein